MTPPADLGDLRALVEAVNNEHAYMLGPGWLRDCGCTICRAFPAARETLERLDENAAKAQEHRDTGPHDGCVCHWCQPNLKARLASLEGALVMFGEKWRWFLRDGLAFHDAFLADCTSLARDTAGWQRVHRPVIQGDAAVTSKVSAQAARDVAYWRKRAERAEALGEKQMAQVTRLEEALVRYGRHESGCPEDLTGTVVLKSEFRQRPCSCGFTAALAGRDE